MLDHGLLCNMSGHNYVKSSENWSLRFVSLLDHNGLIRLQVNM
jgi:hypothetical protein